MSLLRKQDPGLFPRKRELSYSGLLYLDSRFRGNDTLQAGSLDSQPSSAVGGEAGCFIRLNGIPGSDSNGTETAP